MTKTSQKSSTKSAKKTPSAAQLARKKTDAERARLKEAFLQAYQQSAGILQPACDAVGISRKTVWEWRNKDQVFADRYNEVTDIALDFAESALMRQINAGDTTAIIFYLKCKGKERGYIEKQKIEAAVNHTGMNVVVQDSETAERLNQIQQQK